MASPVTSTPAFQPSPYAAQQPAVALPPQSALAFGHRIQDSIRFSGKRDDEEKSGPTFKERMSAATTDALNVGAILGDTVWATIFSAILAIPTAFTFTPILIPCVMASSALFRGLMGFTRGEARYPDQSFKGFKMPFKRNKDEGGEE